jgi:restriction system protein
MLLEWIQNRNAEQGGEGGESATSAPRQGTLWSVAPYQEDAPAIRTAAELAGAIEHLDYAVYRRFEIDRHVERLNGDERARVEEQARAIRDTICSGRERAERLRQQARRADLKLTQLASLTPEGFEEFVAELFEALGFEVECVGRTGDEGVDLRLRRDGLLAIVQCKYHAKGVVGSPDLQKFLGTIHHTRSHKGFFVTTRTFSLAAERFAADHPIELVDGPRLVELVQQALGPGARREPEPAWF